MSLLIIGRNVGFRMGCRVSEEFELDPSCNLVEIDSFTSIFLLFELLLLLLLYYY